VVEKNYDYISELWLLKYSFVTMHSLADQIIKISYFHFETFVYDVCMMVGFVPEDCEFVRLCDFELTLWYC